MEQGWRLPVAWPGLDPQATEERPWEEFPTGVCCHHHDPCCCMQRRKSPTHTTNRVQSSQGLFNSSIGLLKHHCVLAPLWERVPLRSNLEPLPHNILDHRNTFHPRGLPKALHPRHSSHPLSTRSPSRSREQQARPADAGSTAHSRPSHSAMSQTHKSSGPREAFLLRLLRSNRESQE